MKRRKAVTLAVLILWIFCIESENTDQVYYPGIFGLKSFPTGREALEVFGVPQKICAKTENVVIWTYDQFELYFFASGRFGSISVTGDQYSFREQGCGIGSTKECVRQAYEGIESIYCGDNLQYQDGEYNITFFFDDNFVTRISIAEDRI